MKRLRPLALMGRIRAFDWLRGVAVVVMIQTHSVVLLQPELRATDAFRWLNWLDGLVAPSFLFSAGFALALVQVRAALAGRAAEQVRKSLRRIGEVAAVATLINVIWFSPFTAPQMLLRLDILHCVALSLLLTLPLLMWLGRRPWLLRWVALGIALFVFALSPLLEQVRGPLQIFVTIEPGFLHPEIGSLFPLFPWAGYVFLGASFGATVAAMKHEASLWKWLGLLMLIGASMWINMHTLRWLYPAHDFWKTNPANAAERWTLVLTFVAALRLYERFSTTRSRVFDWLAGFGTASLSAYFIHEMLLFQRHVGLFARWFRDSLTWPQYAFTLSALIACTWLSMKYVERLRARFTASGLAQHPEPAPLRPGP